MPLIKIEGPKITKQQKEQLVNELVTSASKILNIPEQAFVTLIKENELENIGSGTELLSNKQK
ncbi:4-oxalocrotonate tautomerase [Clostridium fermenticellae]|uniref:4-oxalocrotonate tautomerase n=1 Tax=Clostridium fermenticellae TaxID=2068654 RepID=A0A386H1U0_9CLOT|nr:4-oxalocrotonate tautomerase DmpI [Clostridium fermenticellae]AYD39652.1 4-oxalocrotonate tautomerase [Clostridium fermenticellae]